MGVQFLTPIIVLFIGLKISKKIEKNKLNVLKEKEWQVKWAEMFLKHATDFNDNISKVVWLLFNLQSETKQNKIDEIWLEISECDNRLSEINWNIKNYAQFSEKYQKDVIMVQQKLMDSITQIISKGEGDLEEVRRLQFTYNKAVRNAHSEILNMKSPKQKVSNRSLLYKITQLLKL